MKSCVAAVKGKGSFRVVIDQPQNLKNHVGPGEKLIVVPGLQVDEKDPKLWDKIPSIVEQVEKYIKWPSSS